MTSRRPAGWTDGSLVLVLAQCRETENVALPALRGAANFVGGRLFQRQWPLEPFSYVRRAPLRLRRAFHTGSDSPLGAVQMTWSQREFERSG